MATNSIDSAGPFRFVHRAEGLYIAGHGMYIRLDPTLDAEALIAELANIKEKDEYFSSVEAKDAEIASILREAAESGDTQRRYWRAPNEEN
jgi:hypothetical protein